MKRHKRSKGYPSPPGAREYCLVCGAVRVWAIPGYKSSGWILNGKPQPLCWGNEVESDIEL